MRHKEVQTKTKMRQHSTPTSMSPGKKANKQKPASVGDDVEVLEPSYIAVKNVKGFGTIK